jgi:hypothetical protein
VTSVRHGSDGLLVLVLGALTLKEADQLARARHGMGATVAIALDTASWGTRPRQEDGSAAADLLRAAGWAVVNLRQGQKLADAWSEITFASAALTPEVSA